MKYGKCFLIGGALMSMLLAGCNIFENPSQNDPGSGGSEETLVPSNYVSNGYHYVTEQNELLGTLGSHNFYKKWAGYGVMVWQTFYKDSNYYTGALLIGEDSVQVQYTIDDKTIESAGSVQIEGKTYFYSSVYGFKGKIASFTNNSYYVGTTTDSSTTVKEVVSNAIFEPVPIEKKNPFLFEELDTGKYQVFAGPYLSEVEDVVIPAKFNDVEVIKVKANGFSSLNNIKTLRFENGSKITTIGSRAFDGCKSLQYAILPSTLTSVGYAAFYNCKADLLVFNGAESSTGYDSSFIESTPRIERCFWGYTDYLVNDNFVFGVNLDGNLAVVRYVGDSTSVTIPSSYDGKSVVSIEKYAFSGQNTIVDVALPSSLISIQTYAFYGCTRLSKIVLPYGATTIGSRAFDGCKSLQYAILPASVVNCGYAAFYNCGSSLVIYSGYTYKPNGFDSNWKNSSTPVYYAGQWGYDSNGDPYAF